MPKIIAARDKVFATTQAYVDREYVLQYWVDGDVDFRVEQRLFSVQGGCAILMQPNRPHGFHTIRSGNCECIYVRFVLPADSRMLNDLPEVVRFSSSIAPTVTARLTSLCAEWHGELPGRDLVAAGLLLEVLGLYVRNAGEKSDEPPSVHLPSWRNVENVIRWMHEHYNQDVDIAEMSRLAGLSPAYFCRSFKRYTGRSPHEYLINIRIDKARELLCDATMTCTRAAEEVGFPDVAAFSRVFRKLIGVSPSYWVRKYLGEQRKLAA
ncbi:MAG: AraC family transcriptional regulator [Capsulimonadaceae bacterium]|nr:AraC family transcriptional regulator [Capsulimonadaceae bacterium]